jgi:hypothetical protein
MMRFDELREEMELMIRTITHLFNKRHMIHRIDFFDLVSLTQVYQRSQNREYSSSET